MHFVVVMFVNVSAGHTALLNAMVEEGADTMQSVQWTIGDLQTAL